MAGVLSLVAVLVGLDWLVMLHVGASPETAAALEVGTFLGLVSLAVEFALIQRATRTFKGDPTQGIFGSFFLRLGLVAPLTLLFFKDGSGVDHEAFALSYCVTFFVFLCWLTWKMARAPVQYQGAARRVEPRKPASILRNR